MGSRTGRGCTRRRGENLELLLHHRILSRDFGLTEGTRDTAEISITDLGKRAVYPGNPEEEKKALLDAFLSVETFRRVLEHYGGNNLPEKRFLSNTLSRDYGIDASIQDEFVDLFQKNCRFVIMPFTERDDRYQTGFFSEVLARLFTPAATNAGFRVKTAERQGSDVIQRTIVNDLLQADLVLADLTEHNPNVLFELGMRMHEDRPVALVRAKGTRPIFDVDNMLRVADYNPNLWPSTVERDIPTLSDHIKATWNNKDSADTFMKILRREGS